MPPIKYWEIIADKLSAAVWTLKASGVPFASSSDRVGSANAPVMPKLVRVGPSAPHDYLLIYRKIGTISGFINCHLSHLTYHLSLFSAGG